MMSMCICKQLSNHSFRHLPYRNTSPSGQKYIHKDIHRCMFVKLHTTNNHDLENDYSQMMTYDVASGVRQGFPGGPVVKNPPAKAGDTGLIPGGKLPHATGQRSPCSITTEARVPYSPSPATRGHCSENATDHNEEWPPLTATRESLHTATKTQESHTHTHTEGGRIKYANTERG